MSFTAPITVGSAGRWFRLKRRHVRSRVERARYGVGVEDTFSFDNYIAGVIARGVRELRLEPYGVPSRLAGEATDEAVEEWKGILWKIEKGMDAYAREAAEWDHPGVQEAVRLFTHWFPDLWS